MRKDGTIETPRSYGVKIANGGQNKAIHRKADANCSITIQQEDGTALMGGEKMRLIDADALCADLETVDPRYKAMIEWGVRVTEAQPTVDAVEVVRCKDCKYHRRVDWGMGDCEYPNGFKWIAYDNDFCSRGERREDNEAG